MNQSFYRIDFGEGNLYGSNTGPLFETYTSITNFAKETHGAPHAEMRTDKDEVWRYVLYKVMFNKVDASFLKASLEHTSAYQQQVQSTRSPFATNLRKMVMPIGTWFLVKG